MDFLSDKSQEVIKTLCRTCMSVRANIDMGRNTTIYKQYLHEKPTGGGRLNLTIMELLQSVHPKLHISADDKLPQVLCLRCIDQLQTTYEFLKMCKDSDEKYRKRLCEPPQIISETHQQQLPRNNPATPFPLVTVKEEIDVMEVAEFDIDIKENDISTYSGSNSNNHRTEFQLSIRDCQTENNQSYGEEEEEEEDNDDTEWVVQGKSYLDGTIDVAPTWTLEVSTILADKSNTRILIDDQLYGQHYEDKMTCIGKGVYCRKHIHDLALNTSHKATQVARKLLEGVFKYDILRQATLTGQQPRAHGLKRRLEPVIPLDITAKSAIIDYSMRISRERGWRPQDIKIIERGLSQRLGEIKRQKRI